MNFGNNIQRQWFNVGTTFSANTRGKDEAVTIANKTATDFTLNFGAAAPSGATVDWLDKTLKNKIEKHAHAMGFGSVQDFTRVMYSTVLHSNLQFSLTSEKEKSLSPAAEARYLKQLKQHEADRKAGKVKRFDNAEEALDYLHSA